MSTPNPPSAADAHAAFGRRAEVRPERLFLREVFAWMSLGLLVTTVVAVGMAMQYGDRPEVLGPLMLPAIVLQLGLVFALAWLIRRMAPWLARTLFLAYAALTGATFSVILLSYSPESVVMAFGSATGVFAGMAAWGWFTKRDLSGLGPVLFGALIGLVVANLVFVFVGGPLFNLLLGVGGVIVFSALTAYDMQKIRQLGAGVDSDSPDGDRAAIYGALQLYLDFINLFLSLLRIFGRR